MIEVCRTVCLEVRSTTTIDEATVDGIVDSICGDTYADVNHYGYCTEIRVEYFDDDYSGKNRYSLYAQIGQM